MPSYTQGGVVGPGFELLFSNFEQFENKFYEVKYQPLFWQKAIPPASIDTAINPGATLASYGVTDFRGVGGFISDFGHDAPTVYFSRDKVTVPMAYAGVKGVYTLEDVRSYSFAYGGQINTELADIMRKASDRHIEGVTMYGQAEIGFDGYIDLAGVAVGNVANPGSGTTWSVKTADQMIADVQEPIRYVWINSKMIHLPDTVELPMGQYSLLNDTRIAQGVDNSALDWLKTHNLYSQQTGRELTIIANPHLDGAGVSGADRMIVKENLPDNFKMPFPIMHNLLPPQEIAYTFNIYAEYKFGPIHCRYPGSMVYRDGI